MSRTDDKAKDRLDDLEAVIDHCAGETPYEVVGAARQLIANCRQHQRADRGALLRMAASIAAGLVQRHTTLQAGDVSKTTPAEIGGREQHEVASCAVAVARAILNEVDEPLFESEQRK